MRACRLAQRNVADAAREFLVRAVWLEHWADRHIGGFHCRRVDYGQTAAVGPEEAGAVRAELQIVVDTEGIRTPQLVLQKHRRLCESCGIRYRHTRICGGQRSPTHPRRG